MPTMKKCNFERDLLPHIVHVAMSAAVIVLSAEILCKVHHIKKGLKEIREGRNELEKAEPALIRRHEEEKKKK